VQSVYPLRNHGGALKLTTALYFTPSGRSIHRQALNAAADDDSDTPSESATTPGPAPAFRTRSGRTVYGGGGITPDIIVAPDSLAQLARAAEDRRLAFRFAGRWTATHGVRTPSDAAAFDAFVAELHGAGLGTSAAELEASRPALQAALAREFAAALRRRGRCRPGLARLSDPVFHKALDAGSAGRGSRAPFFAGPPDPPSPRDALGMPFAYLCDFDGTHRLARDIGAAFAERFSPRARRGACRCSTNGSPAASAIAS